MPEVAVRPSKAGTIVAEAVKAAKETLSEANKRNAAAVKGTTLKAGSMDKESQALLAEKYVRAELESRKEAILDAITAEAVASL